MLPTEPKAIIAAVAGLTRVQGPHVSHPEVWQLRLRVPFKRTKHAGYQPKKTPAQMYWRFVVKFLGAVMEG